MTRSASRCSFLLLALLPGCGSGSGPGPGSDAASAVDGGGDLEALDLAAGPDVSRDGGMAGRDGGDAAAAEDAGPVLPDAGGNRASDAADLADRPDLSPGAEDVGRAADGAADAGPPPPPGPGAAIFEARELPILELTLAEADRQRLRDVPQEPVGVAVRLLGELTLQHADGAGLALAAPGEGDRTVDQKPMLELDFTRSDPGGRLDGLAHLSLDNLLRDWTLQHRWLAARVMRSAGVPAPRVGFVWLRLDGEDLGLYAAIETPDAAFLARELPSTGHLYAGAGGLDLTPGAAASFAVVQGDPAEEGDLDALIGLLGQQPAGEGLYAAGAARLDWDEVLRYFAAEVYVASRWGYVLGGRASYLLHADVDGRFRFLPGDTTHSFEEQPGVHGGDGLLFSRCMADPSCRTRYDAALGEVLDAIDALDPWQLAADQYQRLIGWAVADARLEFDERHISWAYGQEVSFLQQRHDALAPLVACLLDPADDPDGDGFRCDLDCNEADPATHVGAPDLCGDGIDQDCDGVTDDGPDCPDCTEVRRGPHRYLVCTLPRSWEDARRHCQEQGADLAVIDDAGEQEWLRRRAWEVRQQEYWIGLSDREQEGRYLWIDGREPGYTAWAGGQPDNAGNVEDCVHLFADSGLWNDRECTHAAGVLCEDLCPAGQDEDGDGFARCGTDCDDGDAESRPGGVDLCGNGRDEDCSGVADDGVGCDCTEQRRDPHRYLVCTTPRSWADARAYCQAQGLDLTILDDLDETLWLHAQAVAVARQDYWIGLSDQAEEGQFRWVDGSAPTFTHWNLGEPNDAGGAEDCAHYWAGDPTWNDNRCAAAMGVLCEELPPGGNR